MIDEIEMLVIDVVSWFLPGMMVLVVLMLLWSWLTEGRESIPSRLSQVCDEMDAEFEEEFEEFFVEIDDESG